MGVGVGLDPGTDSIKVVQVRTGSRGVSILSAASVGRAAVGPPGRDGASAGPPSVEGLVRAVRSARARRRVTLGVSGRDLMLRYLPVPPVPPWRLKLLVEFEIRENMAGGGEDISSDFHPLNLPMGLKQGLTVLAAIAKNAYLEDAISRARAARIRVNAASPSAVALYRGFIASRELKPGESTFLLDIGRENVEMAIQKDGQLYFARNTTGSGGERLTQAIDAAFGIGRDRAEKYKLGKARLSVGPPAGSDKRQLLIYSALREAGDAIVGAVGAGLRFARMQTKLQDMDFDRLVISGGGARLTGLAKFLEKRLEKPVTVYDPAAAFDSSGLRGSARNAFAEASSSMAVATGLAIMDAETRGFSLSLLPPLEVKRREFWSRTVFGYAAGLLAAVLAGTMYLGARVGHSKADAALATVGGDMKDLEARATEGRKIEEENERARGQVALLLEKASVNRAVLEFLALLRKACPAGLNLTSMKLADPVELTVEFEGRAKNIDEQVFLRKLDEFEANLARSSLVKKDTLKISQIGLRDKKAPAGLHAFRCDCSLTPWAPRDAPPAKEAPAAPAEDATAAPTEDSAPRPKVPATAAKEGDR